MGAWPGSPSPGPPSPPLRPSDSSSGEGRRSSPGRWPHRGAPARGPSPRSLGRAYRAARPGRTGLGDGRASRDCSGSRPRRDALGRGPAPGHPESIPEKSSGGLNSHPRLMLIREPLFENPGGPRYIPRALRRNLSPSLTLGLLTQWMSRRKLFLVAEPIHQGPAGRKGTDGRHHLVGCPILRRVRVGHMSREGG
jgi:hypothetical protein